MFRTTLHVSPASNSREVVDLAVRDAEHRGLAPTSVDQMRGELLAVVEPLVVRAADFERIGSRLVVERQVQGDGYQVTVDCRVGDRPQRLGWLRRLVSR